LRREAIALLRKYPRQEGVWEGYGCAEVCNWVMELEENGYIDDLISGQGRTILRCNDIQEWHRVKLLSIVCSLHKKTIWTKCTSVLPICNGEYRTLEKKFTWWNIVRLLWSWECESYPLFKRQPIKDSLNKIYIIASERNNPLRPCRRFGHTAWSTPLLNNCCISTIAVVCQTVEPRLLLSLKFMLPACKWGK